MSTHATADKAPGAGPHPGPVHRWVLPMQPLKPVNPALLQHAEKRASYEQNRIADRITTFAGSMAFVYIHIIWFGCWIGFGVEEYPFGLLTMIVSLEAIFLSTFVMISQNRAEAKRNVVADQQWRTVQEEDRQNKELICLSTPAGEAEHAIDRPHQPDPRPHQGGAGAHWKSRGGPDAEPRTARRLQADPCAHRADATRDWLSCERAHSLRARIPQIRI